MQTRTLLATDDKTLNAIVRHTHTLLCGLALGHLGFIKELAAGVLALGSQCVQMFSGLSRAGMTKKELQGLASLANLFQRRLGRQLIPVGFLACAVKGSVPAQQNEEGVRRKQREALEHL